MVPRVVPLAMLLVATLGVPASADGPAGRPLVAATARDGERVSGSAGLGGEAVRTALALGATLTAIVVVRHLVRRRRLGGGGPGAAGEVLERLARTPVGRGEAIELLRVGPRVLCVHHGPRGMRTLCEFREPREVDPLLRAIGGASGGEPIETVDLTAPRGRSA